MSEQSVHKLIGQLCESIAGNASSTISAASIKKLRAKSFGVLLKRIPDDKYDSLNENEDEIIKRLDYCLFHQRLHATTFYEKAQCDELEECRDTLEKIGSLKESMQNVVHLLVNLRDEGLKYSVNYNQDDYVFGKFFLEYVPNNKNPYPVFTKEMLTLPKMFTFDDEQSKHLVENPYILCNKSPTFFQLSIPDYNNPDFKKNIESIGSLRLPLKMSFVPSELTIENCSGNKDFEPIQSLSKTSSLETSVPKVYNSFSWDHLGSSNYPKKKPFFSESDYPNGNLHLLSVCMDNFEAKIVPMKTFLRDLRCLAVGVQSETFMLNDLIIFEMLPNVTIENVSTEAISGLVEEFIECGTCFKRLQIMITKNINLKLIVDGFVFKALCVCVEKHLDMFRMFVSSFEDNSVSFFYGRMSTLMQQVIVLAKILGIHPDVPMERKLPTGSEFLALVYNEITRTTQQEMSMFLLYILKECCHIYFKNLQKWIYQGHLKDETKQLFITFYDCYRVHTKYFFDKAYAIRKDAVPAFLQGFEEPILLCGKYAMLLKEFKPDHPVLSVPLPPISVCLSFDEIDETQTNCDKYLQEAHKVCGSPISVSAILAQKAQQREAFYKKVASNLQQNLEKWKQNQELQQHKISENRQLQLDDLKKQIKENEESRVAQRIANIAEEREFLKMEEEEEKKRLLKEHTERTIQIEYYKELHEMAERKLVNTDKKVKELRNTLQKQGSKELDGALESNEKSDECVNNNFSEIKENETKLDYLNSNVSHAANENRRNKTKILGSSLTSTTTSKNPKADSSHIENNNIGTAITSLFTNKSKIMSSEQYASSYRDDNPEAANTNESDELRDNRTKMQSSSQVTDSNRNDLGQQIRNEGSDLMSNRSKMHSSSQYTDTLKDEISKDVSNSPLSDLQKNRNKVMSQEYNDPTPSTLIVKSTDGPLSDLQKNRLKVMSSEYSDSIEDVSKAMNLNVHSSPLSDLQKNRLKVMSSEYAHPVKIETKEVDPNLPLSDLQKNRLRVMSQEYGQSSSEVDSLRSTLNLDLNTDRARNRRKVLGCEYDIITGEHSSISRKACTPMSTGSDTPNLNIEDDIVNGNIPMDSNGRLVVLKLDTNLANEEFLDVPTASSFDHHLTPFSALNTAGISMRNGFVFERRGKITTLNDSDVSDDQDDLKSLFILRIPTLSESFDGDESGKSDMQKLNVSTLHQFLQRSIVIPMNAHLEILNNEILRIFLQDLDILSHFRSMRHYFFLMDGEFATNICDGLIHHLEKGASPAKLLKYQILHSILENSLGSSIIGNDKNAENLSFIVDNMPESFDLSSPNALGMLSLSYRVKWPLNLILNTETIEQCANIFKYLVKLRRISWLLEDAYQNLKAIGKLLGKDILQSPQYRRVQQIRHKIYHFVNALQYHVASNALQISWKKFKDDLLSVRSMEDLYRKHTVYIKRVLFLCMLNKKSAEFHNTIEDIFKVAIRFCRHLSASDWSPSVTDDHEEYVHSKFGKILVDERNFEKLIKYTIYLGQKIVRHGYQTEIGEFINLININDYYGF